MTTPITSSKYIPELDGLRGIAVLGVMIFHAHSPLLQGGFVGVDIFFVLSGFLITSLLVSEFDRSGSIRMKNFYVRRKLRLLPALLTLIVLFCFASFIFLSPDLAQNSYVESAITLLNLANWARAFLWYPIDFLGHTWSLSIEAQFYMIWPILLFWLLRLNVVRTVVLAVPIALTISAWLWRAYLHDNGATIERLYNGLDTRTDAIMVGCAIGVAGASNLFHRPQIKPWLSRIFSILTPIAALGLGSFFLFANWQAAYMYQFGFLAVALCSGVLITDIALAQTAWLKKVLGWKILVWIGSISYGLYLWHYPIYRAMILLQISWPVIITIGSLLTFGISIASYYWIEKPILKQKQRFSGYPRSLETFRRS